MLDAAIPQLAAILSCFGRLAGHQNGHQNENMLAVAMVMLKALCSLIANSAMHFRHSQVIEMSRTQIYRPS